MLGVPIVRGGRVLGVLVVQNRTQRSYSDEEVEIVETVAMVLAELVASGELVLPSEVRAPAGLAAKPFGRREALVLLQQQVVANAAEVDACSCASQTGVAR